MTDSKILSIKIASNKESKTTLTAPSKVDGDLLKYIHKKSPTSTKIKASTQAIPDSNIQGSKRDENEISFTAKTEEEDHRLDILIQDLNNSHINKIEGVTTIVNNEYQEVYEENEEIVNILKEIIDNEENKDSGEFFKIYSNSHEFIFFRIKSS